MKIYVDSDYKCHAEGADGLREFEVDALDGKCKTYVEGMRYVPAGETWTRKDSVTFTGEMLSPWKDSQMLEAAQGAYEDALAAMAAAQEDTDAALLELAAMVDDNVGAVSDLCDGVAELGELVGGGAV